MVCFISGGITNVPNYMENFEKAEKELKSLGFIPFSPAAMTKPLVDSGVNFSDEAWLEIDFAALKQCDAVYHLTNWIHSEGSKKEHNIAVAYDKPVFFQQNYVLYKNAELPPEELCEVQKEKFKAGIVG